MPYAPSSEGDWIDQLRSKFLKEHRPIEIADFGAGYGGKGAGHLLKPLSRVAKSSARKRREGELLLQLVHYFRPKRVLEFGSNLGFSTLYLLAGLQRCQFGFNLISMEGAPMLAALAKQNILAFQQKFPQNPENVEEMKAGAGKHEHIKILEGRFDELLNHPEIQNFSPDLVLIDGNHQYTATLNYVTLLKNRAKGPTILIVDDINWSEGMRKAWNEVRTIEEIQLTIDLYSMGICFLNFVDDCHLLSEENKHYKFRFYSF